MVVSTVCSVHAKREMKSFLTTVHLVIHCIYFDSVYSSYRDRMHTSKLLSMYL